MPHRLLSQLVHVELLTPTLAESVEFAVDVLGLDIVEDAGDSVYLRCWGDHYAHSLILTAAEEPGIGHAAWRTDGPEQLEEAVRRVEASGTHGIWVDSSVGHGPAYRFDGPGGHTIELVWEADHAVAPAGAETPFPARPRRRGLRGLPELRSGLGAGALGDRGRSEQHLPDRDPDARGPHGRHPAGRAWPRGRGRRLHGKPGVAKLAPALGRLAPLARQLGRQEVVRHRLAELADEVLLAERPLRLEPVAMRDAPHERVVDHAERHVDRELRVRVVELVPVLEQRFLERPREVARALRAALPDHWIHDRAIHEHTQDVRVLERAAGHQLHEGDDQLAALEIIELCRLAEPLIRGGHLRHLAVVNGEDQSLLAGGTGVDGADRDAGSLAHLLEREALVAHIQQDLRACLQHALERLLAAPLERRPDELLGSGRGCRTLGHYVGLEHIFEISPSGGDQS